MRNSLALVLSATVAVACSGKPSASVDARDARQLLLDRNWLDRMPETTRDRLHVYRFVPTMGGGVFQDRTLYKGTFELFRFDVTGGEIKFDLPETHQRVTSAFRIERVDGPAPFDLKLTIDDDPRGQRIYYGMRAEHDVDGRALEARLAATHVKM
jgi:hypothetical protein